MTNLSPMQVGAFNPIIDNRYGDFASAQNEKQSQQDKVRQMIEQAEAEGRPLSQSEASLASMLEPNAVSGYNNNLTTQSTLRTNEINQQQEISKLENEEILKVANKLESTDDPLMKKVYYEQFKRRATQAGFFDETDPQEYSEEAENALIGYRDKVLEQARDSRSYGTPASLQAYAKLKQLKDIGEQTGDYTEYNLFRDTLKLDDKGLQVVDGETVPKKGYGEARGDIESTIAGAKANAVLPAKQQEQEMRVSAEQEINKNKEELEINKENRGIAQKDKDNLFKIEQEISTLTQDIDRLLLDKSLDDVVGGFDAVTPDLKSGSRRVANLIEKIKSSAVLDKASKLSGTVSDADMAILRQSANDLDRSLNEEDFRDNAIRFKNTLSTTLKNARDKTQNSNEKPTQPMQQQPKKRLRFNMETGELE